MLNSTLIIFKRPFFWIATIEFFENLIYASYYSEDSENIVVYIPPGPFSLSKMTIYLENNRKKTSKLPKIDRFFAPSGLKKWPLKTQKWSRPSKINWNWIPNIQSLNKSINNDHISIYSIFMSSRTQNKIFRAILAILAIFLRESKFFWIFPNFDIQ